jgi:hypothetical protein
MAASGLKKSD